MSKWPTEYMNMDWKIRKALGVGAKPRGRSLAKGLRRKNAVSLHIGKQASLAGVECTKREQEDAWTGLSDLRLRDLCRVW